MIKSALKSTKILVIEDEATMIRLIREVLDIMGFKDILTVKNGDRGFTEATVKDFDLILCDWAMPGMTGLEFTKKLRALPGNKSKAPIIMITGKSNKEEVEEARDAGVNEYMIKPFSVKSLCQKIKSTLEQPRNFIESGSYKGPDRRRRNDPGKIPNGKDRRKSADNGNQ